MIRIRTFAAIAALAAALAACAPGPETRFADAQEAFAANDFRSARVSLIAGLREKPDDHDMRLLLVRAQIALGDGEGAMTSLAALPEGSRAEPAVLILVGEAELLRGRFGDALAAVDGVATSAADRVRALAHIGQEDFEAAAEAFAQGAARDVIDPRLLAAYARFEMARGDLDRATALAGQALESDPKLVEGYLVQGSILAERNALTKALTAYDEALKLHASNFDGRLGKAQILARLGRFDNAAEIAAELTQEAPNDRGVIFLQASISAGKGEWGQVREMLQPMEADLRSQSGMSAIYGEALVEEGQPALALGILEPELARQPQSRTLRRLVARAQLAASDARSALTTIRPLANRPDATPDELSLAAEAAKAAGSSDAPVFEQRLDRPSPEWVGGELAKADQALRNQQWRDAEARYETILSRTGSRNAMVLNNLAFAKEKQGKTAAALDLALEAAKLEPGNASILDTAGWLLVQRGSRARGLEMLQRAAKIDPDNATIARHLKEAMKQ